MRKRIGLFTGGGDAPGLNGIIESFVRNLNQANPPYDIVGLHDGFSGILNGDFLLLNPAEDPSREVNGLHARAGTILGTTNKVSLAGREAEFVQKFRALQLDGLVALGGDGTFAALSRMLSATSGKTDLRLVGVPKTIDNDLAGTEFTFGFDTACSVIAESVDALRATADAHRRVFVVETMGRTAGWIALGAGLASYAEVVLIPERPFDRVQLLDFIREKKKNPSQKSLMIVCSEGAFAKGESPQVAFRVPGSPQAERYGGIAETLARWIETETGWEARHVVLGHLQRARSPTTTDRFLTLAMGAEAARLVQDENWNRAVVYREGRVTNAPLEDILKPARLVPENHHWIRLAQGIGSFI